MVASFQKNDVTLTMECEFKSSDGWVDFNLQLCDQVGHTQRPEGGDGRDPSGGGHQREVGVQDQMDAVSKPKLALALVQEPPVGKNGRVQADGWRVVAKNNCRAAVLVTQGIHYWALDQFTHRDSSVVCVKLYDKKTKQYKSVYLASIYLDIKFDTITNDLKNLVEYCSQKGVPLIAGIDSNAHNTVWGSPENNTRVEELEEFLQENNLFLMNRGYKPTFVTKHSKTHIDLTIANM